MAHPSGWIFLTGSKEDIKKVTGDYGVGYNKTPGGVFDHMALVVLVNQEGMKVNEYYGFDYDINPVLDDVDKLLVG